MKFGRFLLGAIAGGIATVVAVYGLFYVMHRPYYPPGTWLARAQKSTFPFHRIYALPLNNPDTVPADKADHMSPGDLVVGVVVNGKARAYPWWIITNYHVVNDTIGETPVYLSVCEVCSGAAAYLPVIRELPNRPLIFQMSGMALGTFEISDVQTVSQWHPFTGTATAGPLEGRQLDPIPTYTEYWSEWKSLRPNTDVVYASSMLRLREHGMRGEHIGGPGFLAEDANLKDDRLPKTTLVYGVVPVEDSPGTAFPLSGLYENRFLQTEGGGIPVLIYSSGDYRVMVFDRRWKGEELQMELVSEDPPGFRDQSGTIWNQWGEAVEGPRTGSRLQPARGYLTEWYEWVSAFPGSEIYGGEISGGDSESR